MTTRRRRFTAAFKKRVALEALRGEQPVQAIAAKHQVHPNQVSAWKRQAVEGLDEVFSGPRAKGRPEHEETIRTLHAKIGELTVERDFFCAGWGAESRGAPGDGRAGDVRARAAATWERSPALVPVPRAPRAVAVPAPQHRVDGPGPVSSCRWEKNSSAVAEVTLKKIEAVGVGQEGDGIHSDSRV